MGSTNSSLPLNAYWQYTLASWHFKHRAKDSDLIPLLSFPFGDITFPTQDMTCPQSLSRNHEQSNLVETERHRHPATDQQKPGLSCCWRGERWVVARSVPPVLWFQLRFSLESQEAFFTSSSVQHPPKAQAALTNVCLRKFVKTKNKQKKTKKTKKNKQTLNLGTFRKGVREILFCRTLTRILKGCNWVTSWRFRKYSESASACVLSSLLKHPQTTFLENCLRDWMKLSNYPINWLLCTWMSLSATGMSWSSYTSEYISYISNSIRQTFSGVCVAERKCYRWELIRRESKRPICCA